MRKGDRFVHLVAVLWRSSIIKLLVSFDTSSIFSETVLDDDDVRLLLWFALLWLLLLLYLSGLRSRISSVVGMITDDFPDSSYVVGTAETNREFCQLMIRASLGAELTSRGDPHESNAISFRSWTGRGEKIAYRALKWMFWNRLSGLFV